MASKPPTEVLFSCEICGQDDLAEDKLRHHIQIVHIDGGITCPFCDLDNVTSQEMNVHVNTVHLAFLSPHKTSCMAASNSKNQHLSTKTSNDHDEEASNENDVPSFMCPLCSHKESNPTKLELHINRQHFDEGSPPAKQSRSDINVEPSEPSCPVCGESRFEGSDELTNHVNAHFDNAESNIGQFDHQLAQQLERRERERRKFQEAREFERLKAENGMDDTCSFGRQAVRSLERDVFDGRISVTDLHIRQAELRQHEAEGRDDFRSRTVNPISRLRDLSNQSPDVLRTFLCSDLDHFATSQGDRGWGCGYRNMQTLLSSLAKHSQFSDKLPFTADTVPSISRLQSMVEKAWAAGFDTEGCQQLGGKLVGTRKWIGTTEVAALLSHFQIRCHICDFHQPTGPDGSHQMLFNWVRDYFKSRIAANEEFVSPLYLQHQGHSRTIVGIEELRNGKTRLLVLDPSCSFLGDIESSQNSKSVTRVMKSIRKTVSVLKSRQYQILSVQGLLATEEEVRASKIVRSTRIP